MDPVCCVCKSFETNKVYFFNWCHQNNLLWDHSSMWTVRGEGVATWSNACVHFLNLMMLAAQLLKLDHACSLTAFYARPHACNAAIQLSVANGSWLMRIQKSHNFTLSFATSKLMGQVENLWFESRSLFFAFLGCNSPQNVWLVQLANTCFVYSKIFAKTMEMITPREGES